jgi:hypothetical protein
MEELKRMTGGESVQNVTLEPGMTAWACLAVATNAIVSNSDVVRALFSYSPLIVPLNKGANAP